MTEEEFQESEVIFQESFNDVEYIPNYFDTCNFQLLSCRESRNNEGMRRRILKVVDKKRSAPVSIPLNEYRNAWFRCVDAEFDGGDDGELVPPHVFVARRVAGKIMACSICTGNGRILKGRNLSEFRNLILKMTGFLET